jgi:hypothetical protein
MTLIERLQELPDPRRGAGQRHPLVAVLLMVIMGMMSGRYGYRELGTFMASNKSTFIDIFGLKHGVPSYVTIRTILQNISYASLNQIFEEWSKEHIGISAKDWVSADGKAMKSTVVHAQDTWQNFVSLVSVFHQQTGTVLATSRMDNGKEGEIPTLQQLLEKLGLKGVVLTMDALHCQKKQ